RTSPNTTSRSTPTFRRSTSRSSTIPTSRSTRSAFAASARSASPAWPAHYPMPSITRPADGYATCRSRSTSSCSGRSIASHAPKGNHHGPKSCSGPPSGSRDAQIRCTQALHGSHGDRRDTRAQGLSDRITVATFWRPVENGEDDDARAGDRALQDERRARAAGDQHGNRRHGAPAQETIRRRGGGARIPAPASALGGRGA